MIGAQALVWALVILIGSEFLFVTSTTNQVLVGITLLISSILGLVLVRSVKKEVKSRERIEELADNLVKSNDKLEGANIKLKELDKLKSEFLSLASHQIRNPLTAIKGYASLVLDGTYGEVSHPVREAVDRMYQSTQSLVTIVSDFLDISRIEQGTMKYDFTSFDIKKLAIEVVEEFRPNILHAGLSISSVAGPGDYFVNADQGKIKQVIGNLIDNAIKYTPTGSIKVALSRYSLSDGTSGRVRVTVSDTGVGLDKEVIPQLFAKFTRDKDAFRTNVTGTGLGLYLAKQMVQAHHGKIWAESDGKGKGSRFIIELDSIR
jgi:signal transduction histidine kinase